MAYSNIEYAEKVTTMWINMIAVNRLGPYLNRKDCLLIDLRDRNAYQKSHIIGAVNLPFDSLSRQSVDKLCYQKQKIILYCHRGSMSMRGADLLHEWGYHTASLSGGIAACPQNLLVKSASY